MKANLFEKLKTKRLLIIFVVLILIIGTILFFAIGSNNVPKLLHTSLSSKSSVLAQLVQQTGIDKNPLDLPMPVNAAISKNGKIVLVDQLSVGLISQIDTTTMQVVHVYQVHYSSLGITFNNNDKLAYVVGTYGNITQLNLTTFTMTTINNLTGSYFLDVTSVPNSQNILISDPNNNEIVQYSLNTNKITKTFKLVNSPFDIALSQDGKDLWMTEPQSETIQELSLNNGQIIDTINTASSAFGIALTDNDKIVWITEPFKGEVLEINPTGNKTVNTLSNFNKPAGITVNPANNQIAICQFGSNNVVALNPTTYKQVLSYNITSGSQPGLTQNSANNNPYFNNPDIVNIPNNNKMYFANNSDGWQISQESDFAGTLSGGTIQMTTDSGKTWITDYSGPYNSLSGLDFINSEVGWVLVEPDTSHATSLIISKQVELLQTLNGGITFKPIVTTTPSALQFINFTTTQDGLALDSTGQLLQTTNAGLTWTQVSNAPKQIGSLCQTSAGTYVANGQSVYLKKSDGTWKSIFVNQYPNETETVATKNAFDPFILSCKVNTIIVADASQASTASTLSFAAGSLNGGKNWKVIMPEFPGSLNINVSPGYLSGNTPSDPQRFFISNSLGKIGYFSICGLIQGSCTWGHAILFTQISFQPLVMSTSLIVGFDPNVTPPNSSPTTPPPSLLPVKTYYNLGNSYFSDSGYGWVQIFTSTSVTQLGSATYYVTTNFGKTWSEI